MEGIAIARTRSPDLTRQVMVDGFWHRPMPDMQSLACTGEPYHSLFAPMRCYVLEGELCPCCFTEPERARADRFAQQEKEATQ